MVAPTDYPAATAMHPFRLHALLPCTEPPPSCRKSAAKSGKKSRVNVLDHSAGFAGVLSEFRNHVDDEQLRLLLELGTRMDMRHLHDYDMPIDRCIVRFSGRLSAMWVHHRDAIVWLCAVDGEFLVFALKHGERLAVARPDEGRTYPELRIPAHGVTWTALQRLLVESFEDDESVRAMSAAAMLCCPAAGDFSGVARQLLPSKLRTMRCSVIYDAPVDDDIVTVLADAHEYDGRLFLKCGTGYVAEASMNGSIAALRRAECPPKLRVFEERHDLLMPFLFQ